MTVAELIELLKKCDQSARVVTTGYEGGYCDINELVPIRLKLNVNDEWYLGPHEPTGTKGDGVDAIVL